LTLNLICIIFSRGDEFNGTIEFHPQRS